jgi:hypothetical protein
MKRSCKFLLACTVAALIFTLPLAYAQESGAEKNPHPVLFPHRQHQIVL